MYTHKLKTSNQKCFSATWWPTKDQNAVAREKSHPLMVLESGQVTRVSKSNLKVIK